jgi:hypothetical protein
MPKDAKVEDEDALGNASAPWTPAPQNIMISHFRFHSVQVPNLHRRLLPR